MEKTITLAEFLKLAKEFQDLGWSVQKQLDDALYQTTDLGELNSNALEMIAPFLDKVADVIGDEEASIAAFAIREHLAGEDGQ
jgi:hypothetical protein